MTTNYLVYGPISYNRPEDNWLLDVELYSEDREQLYDVARYVEDETRLHQRFEKLTVDDLVGTECFPCINEVILTKLMTEISDHIIDVDMIVSTVEKRRTCAWYESFEKFYDGILQAANMQIFFKEHSAGFHTAEAKSILPFPY